jgi:ABC-type multidrug transport system ATPase subunit
MRIPNFDFTTRRGLKRAACASVPRLMIIAGPNGSGKSTLLNALRNSGKITFGQSAHDNIIYLGPHRSMFRQNVNRRNLLGDQLSIERALSQQGARSHEGVQQGASDNREPWDYDPASNHLKHALCQVELERQRRIAERFDLAGEIPRNSLPDPWSPLRDMTSNLLPHLRFERIDASNPNDVKCVWVTHDGTDVDLNDLSSGEKSVIQMVYPLVERNVQALLREMSGESPELVRPEQCLMIDEPELHLHPSLQMKVIDYLRVIAGGQPVQVIVATHSTTIVEYASYEELYLLRPAAVVADGENQLTRIADDEQRLEMLRNAFGSTSNLTALQQIVVVEGVAEGSKSGVLSDRKIYRTLHQGFDRVTLLPGGGKAECRALLTALNGVLGQFSTGMRAIALLDRDMDVNPNDNDVVLLPVSMIENFLLDPHSIWEAIQSVVEKTGFRSVEDVATALTAILDQMHEREVNRRAVQALGTAYFRPSGPLMEVPEMARRHIEFVESQFATDAVAFALASARSAVDALTRATQRREHFHGKDILYTFYGKYLHSTGLSKTVFCFETARHSRERRSVREFFDGLFASKLRT